MDEYFENNEQNECNYEESGQNSIYCTRDYDYYDNKDRDSSCYDKQGLYKPQRTTKMKRRSRRMNPIVRYDNSDRIGDELMIKKSIDLSYEGKVNKFILELEREKRLIELQLEKYREIKIKTKELKRLLIENGFTRYIELFPCENSVD